MASAAQASRVFAVYKYQLAYVRDGVCVLRFDNEAGKGNHRHAGGGEIRYDFTTPERLIADFWAAIDGWKEAP